MDHAMALWNLLRRVHTMRFVAQSLSETNWTGIGEGNVAVTAPGMEVLVYTESGRWTPVKGTATNFNNVFRWSLMGTDGVRLEHLRFGPDKPIHLFDMRVHDDGIWRPEGPHLCSEDCYSAELEFHSFGVNINWSITGPRKNESIRYEYRW